MEQDLSILPDLGNHPSHPFQSVQPVHGAKTDIRSLTVAVGSLIDQQHPETMFQIVIGKAAVIIQSFAGISVKTDHRFRTFVPFEIRTVQLQAVPGSDPHILVGLFHHPFPSFPHQRYVLFPVYAGHLHGPFHFCIVPFHGPAVKICGAAGFRRCRRAQKQGGSFQQFTHFLFTSFCCRSVLSVSALCQCCLPPSVFPE